MMTEQELTARLTHIEEQAAAMQERVDGYRDQELAKAFLQSEWTQEQLAAFLSKLWGRDVSRPYISQRLLFGRFLQFFVATCNKDGAWKLPRNLTEGRFRNYWERTSAKVSNRGHKAATQAAVADEQRRFAEVAEMMQDDLVLSRDRRKVADALRTVAAGKGWKSCDELRDLLQSELDGDISDKDIYNAAMRMKTSHANPYRVESTVTKSGTKYRIVKVNAVVPDKKIQEWKSELAPLLKTLIAECRKDRVERDGVTIASIADKLQKILDTVPDGSKVLS